MSYRGYSKGNYGTRKLQRFHARRSNWAKRIDEGLRAPIAKSPEQWLQQPNRFDIPVLQLLKTHMALGGKTPAQQAKISDGSTPEIWQSLIKKATDAKKIN